MEDQSPLGPHRIKSPREFIPTRQSLFLRLQNQEDARSWVDFFNTYWNLIYGVAYRAGLSNAEVKDVVQETRSAGSFKTWKPICLERLDARCDSARLPFAYPLV